MNRILPPTQFEAKIPYRFLPFQFMKWSNDEFFLSNMAGEYCFLDREQFSDLVNRSLATKSQAYKELKSKHFIYDANSTLPIELTAIKYRTKKGFLEGFTKLHLFIVTLRCDHSCPYCAASSVPADLSGYDMDQFTARKAADLMLSCPANSLKVEFQGGEPLLNFDVVRFITEYVKERTAGTTRDVEFVLCTNLASLDSAKMNFIKDQTLFISTSFDGPRDIHNANRHYLKGSSYDVVKAGIHAIISEVGKDHISALMTTTDLSIKRPYEIIDEYIKLGLDTIFLRAIRPYGRLFRSAARYSTSEFLNFYQKALDYIIAINRKGTFIVEGYAQVILGKIMTPFATGFVDIQSPGGAGISFVAYNYTGDVYASDEGRMLAQTGDNAFRMGNVITDSYEEIFCGQAIRTLVDNSCVEVLPGCAECAFQVYCGADPIHNYTQQGDIVGHRPTSDFCEQNRAIIRLLLDYIKNGDDYTRELFLSWISPRPQIG